MDGLTVYVKEGLPFEQGLSLENNEASYLFFSTGFTYLVSYFFSPPTFTIFIFVHGYCCCYI